MKKFYIILALIAICSTNVFSQAKVETKISDKYSRNSVTKMYIAHNDNIDNIVEQATSAFNFGEKYDYNDIGISKISDKTSRGKTNTSDLTILLNQQNVAKSIVSFWLNRDAEGRMNDDKMRERSLYNVNDGEIMIAEAAKVSRIADMGDGLIKNSYIVIFDTEKVERKTSTNKKTGKTTVTWNATTSARVFNIMLDSTFIDDLYSNMWIQDDDNAEEKTAKKKRYDELQLYMTPVAYVNCSSSSTVTQKNPEENAKRTSILNSFDGLLDKMEKKIPQWQVKVAIYDTNPIRSKIGTKENLANGIRYRVYKYTEDQDGVLKMKPVGYVRATEIAKNDSVASGKSPTSRFYQIAGGHLEPGMLMRENKDKKIALSLGGKYHGANSAFLDIDYLMHISNFGGCSYFMLGLGFDYRNAIYMDFNGGFGYGIPLTRWFELMPYAKIGADAMGHEKDENKDHSYSTLYAEGGARLSFQPIYPLRLFIQADYSLNFLEGNCYEVGDNRFGLGLSAGLRYAF